MFAGSAEMVQNVVQETDKRLSAGPEAKAQLKDSWNTMNAIDVLDLIATAFNSHATQTKQGQRSRVIDIGNIVHDMATESKQDRNHELAVRTIISEASKDEVDFEEW